jgi:hypothetical protein
MLQVTITRLLVAEIAAICESTTAGRHPLSLKPEQLFGVPKRYQSTVGNIRTHRITLRCHLLIRLWIGGQRRIEIRSAWHPNQEESII